METHFPSPQQPVPAGMRRGRAKLADINAFLAQKRLAIIGVSRNEQDYTRLVMREFESRGYEVVPVNPAATEVAGHRCFARVQETTPPVTAALLLTPSAEMQQTIGDCVRAGVRYIWIRRHSAQDAWAAALCRQQGISMVAGECPLMFLPETAGVHRFHGMVRKITLTYPR